MEKKFLTELLRSTVISPRVLEEWRDKAAQRKGQCDGMLGTLCRGGGFYVSMETARLAGMGAHGSLIRCLLLVWRREKLHFHDSYRLAEQVAL